MKLLGRLLPLAEVTPLERGQMFALMTRYYENVSRASFDADLAEKRWVIQLIDPATRLLCGFSTQTILEKRPSLAGPCRPCSPVIRSWPRNTGAIRPSLTFGAGWPCR